MIDPNQTEPTINSNPHPDLGNYSDGQGHNFTLMAVYLNHGEQWAHYKNTQTNEEYNATLASFKQRFSRQP